MGNVEIDLLKSLLAFEPSLRSTAEKFLKHPYFDCIRNSIENEINDLSELDQEEYQMFNNKKSNLRDEKQIIKSAFEF